jgi:hypothetical protein
MVESKLQNKLCNQNDAFMTSWSEFVENLKRDPELISILGAFFYLGQSSEIDIDLGCFFYLGQSSEIVVIDGFRSKKIEKLKKPPE